MMQDISQVSLWKDHATKKTKELSILSKLCKLFPYYNSNEFTSRILDWREEETKET